MTITLQEQAQIILNSRPRTVAEMMHELREINKERLHVQLSNLYLSIERGDVELTITNGNMLRALAGTIWQDADEEFIRDHWMNEFQKLPGWLEV